MLWAPTSSISFSWTYLSISTKKIQESDGEQHRGENRSDTSSRMPGNHIHGNGLPSMFVPGRRNVCEGYWAVDESFKKITRFSFPLLLKRKKYFTNPSCLHHWQRKTSPRSTVLVSRIGLQPFLHTRWYPTLVLCSATAVEADFGVRPKVWQYTRQVLKASL